MFLCRAGGVVVFYHSVEFSSNTASGSGGAMLNYGRLNFKRREGTTLNFDDNYAGIKEVWFCHVDANRT